MEWDAEELAARIRERALPEAVVVIATEGGTAAHPALEYRAESVWSPAWMLLPRAKIRRALRPEPRDE